MKKVLFTMLVGALTLTGCLSGAGDAPEGDPDEVVRTAMMNMQDYKSYTFQMDLVGSVLAAEEEMKFDFEIEGAQDLNDPKGLKFIMEMDGKMSVAEFENEEFSAELRFDTDMLYFVLNSLSDFDGNVPEEMVEPFVGQWFSFELPEEILNEVSPLMSFALEGEEDLTPEQKELKELAENTNFFTNAQYVGAEKGLHIYSADLDKEAMRDFMVKAVALQGETVGAAELEELRDVMDSFKMDVEIGIDSSNMTATMMTGNVSVLPPEGEGAANFDFTIVYDDLGESVAVDVPKDVKEFDPMMLFGAAMMMNAQDAPVAEEK